MTFLPEYQGEKMSEKKKNPVKEVQPKAVKLNKDVDLNEIGSKKIVVTKDAPKVNSKTKGPDGKMITDFANINEDGGTTVMMDVLQPFITVEDVRKIGIAEWHVFRTKPNIVYTTVINGRRFKMYAPEFLDAKNQGLVIQVG